MFEIFNYSFMVRAFIAGIIIGTTAPLIGNFLVVRRYALIADTLSHVAISGVAIAMILGTQPLLTTVVVTTLAAILIEKLRSNKKLPGDTVLSMFLPGGLALSIVLISLVNGLNINLFNFLFGSITTVKNSELWLILGLGFLTLATTFLFHKKLLYSSFDEDVARVSGVPVEFMNFLLIVLTSITVSLSMRVVGVLLIGALMTIPTITAMLFARSFSQSLIMSVIMALISVIGGLFAAFYLSLPAGGAIVLLSLVIFIIVFIFNQK